ncbi:hypothetical protein IHE45_15G035400 [Dioscorea alata]|nr:hypothetical protein IHE45_15G035400 [Dioscorea alata]KAH7661033.1 hypothetical protein IHE45_15G035400 [Dioscorea alata]
MIDMEHCCNSVYEDKSMDHGRMIVEHPPHLPKLSHWLDLRVFYVRFSNFKIDESTPEHLTLNHIPLTTDTILEVNGQRSFVHSECVSCLLKKDRIDRKSEEATFVNTDTIRMTGNTRFEVYDKDNILLSGVLELRNANFEESKNHHRNWSMKCEPMVLYRRSEMPSPTIEVYVTGFCSSMPIILTKTLHIDSIPKHGITKSMSKELAEFDLQVLNDSDCKENDVDIDYNSTFFTTEYFDMDDGELSWFNAGLRVGVGLGLSICLGIGIGVSLFVHTYQVTARNFTRRRT